VLGVTAQRAATSPVVKCFLVAEMVSDVCGIAESLLIEFIDFYRIIIDSTAGVKRKSPE
jgi:hypothetical protein